MLAASLRVHLTSRCRTASASVRVGAGGPGSNVTAQSPERSVTLRPGKVSNKLFTRCLRECGLVLSPNLRKVTNYVPPNMGTR